MREDAPGAGWFKTRKVNNGTLTVIHTHSALDSVTRGKF